MARTRGGYKITRRLIKRNKKAIRVYDRLKRMRDAGTLDPHGLKVMAKIARRMHKIYRPDLRPASYVPPTPEETAELFRRVKEAWKNVNDMKTILAKLEAAKPAS